MSSAGAGMWVCLDGVEGAGKTTLANELRVALPGAIGVAEFSEGVAGRVLAEAVADEPHHISKSPLGQSLLFLAEFCERVDVEILPALRDERIVIHDRGWLSKYAYQHAVLEPALGIDGARGLLDAVFASIRRPELTIHLHAPEDVIVERLIGRDGHCDNARVDFISRAEAAMRQGASRLGRVRDFDTSRIDVAELARVVVEDTTAAGTGT